MNRLIEKSERRELKTELVSNSAIGHSPLLPAREQREELEIARLARAAWSKMGYLLACAAVCAVLGYGIAKIEKPVYRSSATVELLGVNSDFLNLREVQPNADANVPGTSEAYMQTQIELFSSSSLVRRTLEKLGRLPAGTPALGSAEAAQAERTLADYAKRLRVEQVKESNLLQITFDDKSAAFAAQFVNTLVAEATKKDIEDRWKSNDRLGMLFSKQVDVLRHRMEEAEGKLQDYSRQSGLLYTGEDKSVAEGRLNSLEEERSRADADLVAKQAQYSLVQSSDPASLPQILGNETLRSYQQKLTDLRRERADLAAIMTPENPKVHKVDAQIAALQTALARETQNVIAGVVNDYKAAKQRSALLQAASGRQAGQVSEQAEKAIHYNTLKREVETTRALYEAMLRRMNDAEVMSTINTSDLRVVDAAPLPLKPAKPNKAVYAGIGFLNGLLFPLVFVFVREYRNRAIEAPEHMPSLLHFRELGAVPSARTLSRVIEYPKAEAAEGALLAPRPPRAGLRQAENKDSSLLKDSFRHIAASILFNHSQPQKPLALVVSSPHEGDGKTTTAYNVGLEMARMGRRILLIDGDLRRPTLHRFFALPNATGLIDALGEEKGTADPMLFVQKTAAENVSLMPAGMAGELSAAWLQMEKLKIVLAKLREEFDLILIDSAPLLLVPETRLLANAADGLVLVFRAGKTSQDEATAACRRAAQDGTQIFGTVLNDWKPLRNRYSYYAQSRA